MSNSLPIAHSKRGGPRAIIRWPKWLAIATFLMVAYCALNRPVTLGQVLIVTLNSGAESASYKNALENHEAYANCHGYGFINAVGLTPGTVHPFMQKAYALREILTSKKYDSYKYILWIDRDAVFLDHQVSLQQRLNQLKKIDGIDAGEDNVHLLVAVERWAWLNSGVLLFRNSEYSKKLVDDWIDTYAVRNLLYENPSQIHVGGVDLPRLHLQGDPKRFKDIVKQKPWSCEDQGALIALLAGFDAKDDEKKWKADGFDALGVPHFLHTGDADWAKLSSKIILDPRYQPHVKIVPQVWFNTNHWDYEKHNKIEQRNSGWMHIRLGRKTVDPFIFHFNGQKHKIKLVDYFAERVTQCHGPKKSLLFP